MKSLALILAAILATVPAVALAQQQKQEVVDLEGVIQLVRAGVSDDIIIAVIKAAKASNFDTSPAGVIAMKQAGLSEPVIKAALEKQTLAPSSSPARLGKDAEGQSGGLIPPPVSLVAGDRQVSLTPSAVMIAFAKKGGKLADAMKESAGSVTETVALMKATELIMGASMATGPLARLAGPWALETMGRVILDQTIKDAENPTVRARQFFYLEEKAAPDVGAPLVLRLPAGYAGLDLGAYEPVLAKLTIPKKERVRLIETREVNTKPHAKDQLGRPAPEIHVLKSAREQMPVQFEREGGGISVKAASLPPGHYAFLLKEIKGDGYAQYALEFKVVE
ncbi:MAG: hypothetical protein AAB403_06285 [Planctomycetota bacterium]